MKNRKMLFLALLIVAVFAVFTLAACDNDKNDEGAEPEEKVINFSEIVKEITGGDTVPYYITLGADGSYCIIDTNPYDKKDYYISSAIDAIIKMNKALEFPDYVYEEMMHTSYMQGKQTVELEKVSVTWYYHPDKGLNAMYKKLV